MYFLFGRRQVLCRVVYISIGSFIQVKYCEDRGMSFSASSRLILFMGIQLVVGRFACGFLCSYKRLDNWYIHQAMLLINGVSTMLLTLATNYEAFVAYAVIFGFCDGAWNTVNTIQALACVDSPRAASACGFMLLAGSVTSLIGPPLSGRAWKWEGRGWGGRRPPVFWPAKRQQYIKVKSEFEPSGLPGRSLSQCL